MQQSEVSPKKAPLDTESRSLLNLTRTISEKRRPTSCTLWIWDEEDTGRRQSSEERVRTEGAQSECILMSVTHKEPVWLENNTVTTALKTGKNRKRARDGTVNVLGGTF